MWAVVVVQQKTVDVDGYQAVKVGYEPKKKVNRPIAGQFEKVGVEPMRILREFHSDETFEPGQVITVADMFAEGDRVDVSGTSKGKGYQGAIKRHGLSRGPMSHGSKYHRHAGSMGPSATPGKVRKGKKLPGQMGAERVTVQNLTVVKVDSERGMLVIRGALPGANGGLLEIKSTVKVR